MKNYLISPSLAPLASGVLCLAKRRWTEARVTSIRGNVPTRMGRVQETGDRRVDGVLLAMAGILRLELNQEEGYEYLPLNPETFIPRRFSRCFGDRVLRDRSGDAVAPRTSSS